MQGSCRSWAATEAIPWCHRKQDAAPVPVPAPDPLLTRTRPYEQLTSLEGSRRRLVASHNTCGELAAGMWVSFTDRHVTVDAKVCSCCVAEQTCCAVVPQRRTHSTPKCCSQNCCNATSEAASATAALPPPLPAELPLLPTAAASTSLSRLLSSATSG